MLAVENTALIVIDVQEKLVNVMPDRELLVANLKKLITGINVMGIPAVYTEQYPKGLGMTLSEIAGLLSNVKPVTKMSFSCCGDMAFLDRIKALDRKQILIAGAEAHVCVYQTVCGLLDMGYEVQVVSDCVSSRTAENKKISIEKMRDAGAQITSMEMALFELLKTAESPNFKDVSRIIK